MKNSLTNLERRNIFLKCAYARKGRTELSRVVKSRRVCRIPENLRFIPEGSADGITALTVEEIESLRLCDMESMEQDKAADRMNISRGTLQRILYSARRKVAEALCRGREIHIDGGHFVLSESRCRDKKECGICRFRQEKIDP